MSENIRTLFLQKRNREIIEQFQPHQVAEFLGFDNSLKLAYRLLYNAKWDEDLQDYAILLICEVKTFYPDEWEKDWRFDAFLGSAYDVVSRDDSHYDKRYEAYRRAYQKANPPPPELMTALAGCIDAPGKLPILYEEAEMLAKKAFAIEPYSDAAGILCAVFFAKGMEAESQHWAKIRDELFFEKGKTPPPLEPTFVREGYE